MKTIIVENKSEEDKKEEEVKKKKETKVRIDQELIDGFTHHLKLIGFNYKVDGFCFDEGVKKGEGVDVWIKELGIKIKLILNHSRSVNISLSDKCDLDGSCMCVVISSSEKNNLGYISKGVEMNDFKKVIEESGGCGWRRKLRVDELREFNIKHWLVGI